MTRCLFVLALASFGAAWVELDPDLIPQVDDPLPIYSLGAPSFIPDQLLETILGTKLVQAEGSGTNDSKAYAYNGDTILGYVDRQTGETRVFPDYGSLEAVGHKAIDVKAATRPFEGAHSAMFPPDDTTVELVKGYSLVGSDLKDSGDEGSGTGASDASGSKISRRWNDDVPDSVYLTLGSVQRFVDCGGKKYPVCGPGSQATFGVATGDKVVSLSYLWRPAKKNGNFVKPFTKRQIVKHIKKALEAKAIISQGIKIYRVDTCFYDSGVGYLQPVYRILGDSYAHEKNKTLDTSKILRYFPIGEDSPEVLPDDTSETQAPPLEPEDTPRSLSNKRSLPSYFAARSMKRGIKPNVTVGRYVTRNDTYQAEFLANANGIWASLSTSSSINFVNQQYYWAYPWLYGGSLANSYVNSVNVAFTESHGANHLFSTWADSGSFDAVSIPGGLLDGGYGPNNGGALGYWVINSCEVIPARIDFATDPAPKRRAFDPWWPVFRGGLHAVLGWRTSPFFSDNVAVNTAKAMALGRPVASAWLDAAHTDPAFNGRPTYVGHSTGVVQPIGRAAVIYPCGHGSDVVWQLEGLGRPTCLTMRYWNND